MIYALAWNNAAWARILARVLACRPGTRLCLLPEGQAEFAPLLAQELARQGVDVNRVQVGTLEEGENTPLFLLPLAALPPHADPGPLLNDIALACAAPLMLGAPLPGLPLPQGYVPQGEDNGQPLAPAAFEDHFTEAALQLLARDESRFYKAEALRRTLGLPSLIPSIMAEIPRPEGGLRRVRTHGLDLGDQLSAFYGKHRSGWNYALGILAPLHNPKAPYLESFVEKRFNWGDWMNDHQPPLEKPWLGFFHVPPHFPAWFSQTNSFLHIRETPRWKRSLPWCRGLFTLTHWLKEQLEPLTDLPIRVLPHPAESVNALWSPQAYLAQERPLVLQAGITYRNLHAVHMLGEGPFAKMILRGPHLGTFNTLYTQEENWLLEQDKYRPGADANTVYADFMENQEYDRLFSENVVLCEYYTASASNTVVECIVRNTPLLINPLPPIVEYLGEHYPLYFNSYEEATEKLCSKETVLAAHHYLADMDKRFLSPEHFLTGLMESDLYKSL